jgi:hypothetical protein
MKEGYFRDVPPPYLDSIHRSFTNAGRTFGEIGMRPRIHVLLTPEEQKTYTNWSRGVVGAVILLAVVVVGVPLLSRAIVAPVSVAAAVQGP